MSSNSKSAKVAAKTKMKRYGKDFYKRIGAIGGSRGKTGGFYNNPEAARAAGLKGRKSREEQREQKAWRLC